MLDRHITAPQALTRKDAAASVSATTSAYSRMHPVSDVTALLKAWRGGDQTALERLTPLVYDHLRKLGRQYVRKERAGARADATSLVHEAYMRLVDARTVDWQDRAHFFAVSSTIMRRILVDAARARASAKRGGDLQRVENTTTLNLDALPAAGTDRASRNLRARRRIGCACQTGAAPGEGDRTAVFRRAERRRNGRSARRLSADRVARLEAGAGVAGGGAQELQSPVASRTTSATRLAH